ncbi:uncharacterized protein C8Q71DRAFT_854328 [Rhodofomes roseus]|uniref:Uncharacterized protein n=1 Tax=Rhodofomes roseus TaxID=34475 RepID=A0ABQ8KV68_9APHY|nr:uncharacterized protein C8Q71DRAFT_854328 [Rhodofomes roseus]KAH9841976.1 hypothetical protein C8Q71DRAFT_854328 [Rhodofomes roseus]
MSPSATLSVGDENEVESEDESEDERDELDNDEEEVADLVGQATFNFERKLDVQTALDVSQVLSRLHGSFSEDVANKVFIVIPPGGVPSLWLPDLAVLARWMAWARTAVFHLNTFVANLLIAMQFGYPPTPLPPQHEEVIARTRRNVFNVDPLAFAPPAPPAAASSVTPPRSRLQYNSPTPSDHSSGIASPMRGLSDDELAQFYAPSSPSLANSPSVGGRSPTVEDSSGPDDPPLSPPRQPRAIGPTSGPPATTDANGNRIFVPPRARSGPSRPVAPSGPSLASTSLVPSVAPRPSCPSVPPRPTVPAATVPTASTVYTDPAPPLPSDAVREMRRTVSSWALPSRWQPRPRVRVLREEEDEVQYPPHPRPVLNASIRKNARER